MLNILLVFHTPNGISVGDWSTPLGLAKAFTRKDNKVDLFGIHDVHNCNFDRIIPIANNYDFIFCCMAGPCDSFDKELIKLKDSIETPILLELGDDEPNGFRNVQNRIHIPHIIFPPDLRCHKKYISMGLNTHWLPFWCDDELFYRKENTNRKNICVTTCGDRPYAKTLHNMFQDKFINKRVSNYDNTDFYNSGTITYQYARYDEITRRLFEAGGCGNALLTNRISKETGIFDLFEEDEDIVYFTSEEECIEKMDKLLKDDEYRNKISNNSYQKITNNHLIGNRVDTILKAYYNL